MVKFQGSNFRVDQVKEPNEIIENDPWLYRIEMGAEFCNKVAHWLTDNGIEHFKTNFSIWITTDEDLTAFLLRWSKAEETQQ